MLPFLHLGPVTLPTFGLLAATGMLTAYFVLRADLRRRGLAADPATLIGTMGIAGIAGARIYHLLQSPEEFFKDPLHLLFGQAGLAWFGGFLGGFIALLFLARHYRMPALLLMDICSPAAALGYGIGRIGCLVSGDGDYGVPTSLPWGMSFPDGIVPTSVRVHPTPIYEFLAAVAIFYVLWRFGAKEIAAAALKPKKAATATHAHTAGYLFAYYLLLSGVARFLVEFIRINPRVYFGLTNAQTMSLASVIAGTILLLSLNRAPQKEKRAG